jgi:hypothetical protein
MDSLGEDALGQEGGGSKEFEAEHFDGGIDDRCWGRMIVLTRDQSSSGLDRRPTLYFFCSPDSGTRSLF